MAQRSSLAILFGLVLLLLPRVATAAVLPIAIPDASVAIDGSGSASLDEARKLSYVPASSFSYPGRAGWLHPLVLWVRFDDPIVRPAYLAASPAVGYGWLYFVPANGTAYQVERFGMRVPVADRTIDRIPPTLEFPDAAAAAPMYARLAIDDESNVVPALAILDSSALAQQDAQLERLASTAVFFIGIFISLAAANIFVFLFVRERAYIYYSAMMLSNALFASSYMHGSSWRWFWPHLSLPDQPVQAAIVTLNAVFLILFARAFLHTKMLVPKADRIATYACAALISAGVILGYGFPSTHFLGSFTGREAYLVNVVAFVIVVFLLGVAALRAGSPYARFFVASNAIVSIAASMVAIGNFTHHDPTGNSDFVGLMTGQAVEGWLLFGALAFRLKQVIWAHNDEQKQRILAQAEALAQARALLESRQMASTDALTGIANRRAFDEMYEREWDRCARRAVPLSMLMLDIDFFKRYNDRYGHVAGDECLRRVAGAIAGCVKRPSDYCARYGGEEFAVVLGDTDEAGAAAIAGEILNAVRALRLPHADSPHGIVTVSIGCGTTLPRPGTTPDLVERSDEALYDAKEFGRNRLVSRERSQPVAS